MTGLGHLGSTFQKQAEACASIGSVMYAELLTLAVDDIEAGGPTLAVLAGHEDDPGPSALALRLLGRVHRLVLEGSAPELEPYYPSVGGWWRADEGWPAFQALLVERRGDIAASLDQAPQTNDVGRSAALLGGLLHVAEATGLPVVLHEIGASAGLNLRADAYLYGQGDRWWGPAGSLVELPDAWRGRAPPLDAPLRVVGRHGSDLAPIDATTPDGRARVQSYVWPDMADRLARLRAALDVAERVPVELTARDALDAVRAIGLTAGYVTVLWHSVMWQYLSRPTRQGVASEIDRLGSEATEATEATRKAPFAHLAMEPMRRTPDVAREFLVTLRMWPGGDRRILGTAAPHGVPTTWE